MLKEDGKLTPNFWRAPTDNDMGAGLQRKFAVWKEPGIELTSFKWNVENDMVVVNADYDMKKVSAKLSLTYVINNKGAVKVTQKMTADTQAKVAPMFRFGMQVQMPKSFETIEYYGRGRPDILVEISNFIHVGIGVAVGTDQTIVTEVVVGPIKAIEVTTVSINADAIFPCPTDGLIHKVPNKTSLQGRILTNQIPIFLETTLRIAHRMCIFALNQRFLDVLALGIFFHVGIVGIHRTINIGKFVAMSLLILHGAARIFRFHPIVGRFKVRAETSFIA